MIYDLTQYVNPKNKHAKMYIKEEMFLLHQTSITTCVGCLCEDFLT